MSWITLSMRSPVAAEWEDRDPPVTTVDANTAVGPTDRDRSPMMVEQGRECEPAATPPKLGADRFAPDE
jgi:hypothetical protein